MSTQVQTPAVDLSPLGYPEWYTHPMDYKLFEVTPTTHCNWDLWSHPGSTGEDMYLEMSGNNVVSDTAGLPTLRHYLHNQGDIPENWFGHRVFGLKGVVVHRDGDHVSPYLDCQDSDRGIYIGYFRLKGLLDKNDVFIVLQRQS